jgi:large subunit ribosomal protein L29
MKPSEIQGLEASEINDKLKDARAELFNLRFQLATGQLDNTGRINHVKKDIARLQTELRARELRESDAAAS